MENPEFLGILIYIFDVSLFFHVYSSFPVKAASLSNFMLVIAIVKEVQVL